MVRGDAESGGVVVQRGVYAERGAFGQAERSAIAIGGASDKIPETSVGYIDGQGIIFSFADIKKFYKENDRCGERCRLWC